MSCIFGREAYAGTESAQKPRLSGGAFEEVWRRSVPVDTAGTLAPLPAVQCQPAQVNGSGQGAEGQHHPQVQAAEEIPDLGNGVQDRTAGDILSGHQVHHANGVPGQFQLHSAHDVALLDRGADIFRQVEELLGHAAISGGGEDGHHAVIRVQLKTVGLCGVFHGQLCQGYVRVQCGLDGKAVKHPVDQLCGLTQGGAAVGIAVIVAAVRTFHHAEQIGLAIFTGPGDIALGAGIFFIGHHIAHTALHGAAVELAAAGAVQGHILTDQHKGLRVFFLGGHRKGRGGGDLCKGVKAHQIPQDQIHIHSGGAVAAVQAAGIGPGAVGGANALGQGVHLGHPAGEVAAGQSIGYAHGSLVGVAGQHGVDGFPHGKGLVGAHIGIVRVVDIVRDGKGHGESGVQFIGVVGQDHRNGHIFGQPASRDLTAAVFFVNDDIGVSVDDIGAGSLYRIDGAGVKQGTSRGQKTPRQNGQCQKKAKQAFHVDNSFKKR